MGKTFDQSLIDTATIPMSMIDPEDMQDNTSEEFTSLRRIQQGAHNELSNREDFPFNILTKTLSTKYGQNAYPIVDGRIKRIISQDDNSELEYVEDFLDFGNQEGKPQYYTMTENPEKLKLYPTPNGLYTLDIEFYNTKNVIPQGGGSSYIITNGSTLRMPERFQHLYFDALEYYVLYQYMRKASNPRFEPTYRIFTEKWQTFLRGSKTVESETRFTI